MCALLSQLNKIIGAKKQGICFQKSPQSLYRALHTLSGKAEWSFVEGTIFLQVLAFVLVGEWPVSRVALESQLCVEIALGYMKNIHSFIRL